MPLMILAKEIFSELKPGPTNRKFVLNNMNPNPKGRKVTHFYLWKLPSVITNIIITDKEQKNIE